MTDLALPKSSPAHLSRALSVLLSKELESIVDLVAWSTEPDVYHVASHFGEVRFQRRSGRPHTYSDELLRGASPVATQDPTHLGSLASEMATPHPSREHNSYPHAYDHVAQIFDHPSAPDFVVLHTGSHYWGDQGGHLGEHGSLGVLQSRAPFIASGAGVKALGMLDDSCRLIDVAPTILALLGITNNDGAESNDVPLDGHAVSRVLSQTSHAKHVVAMLLDGTNPNVLYDLAARGEAPHIARLMERGTTYRYGATASLPSVTLANHTAILTGRHPGHHGVLHNAWIDRVTAEQVITNSPSTWTTAMQWLAPGVSTVHDMVHRAFPGSLSISINEPCDVGSDFSIFHLMRKGENVERPPRSAELPDATERFVRPSKDYRWASLIDHTAVDQFRGIWSGSYRGETWAVPTFSWVNFTLTDAAFHEGGPYSEIAAASVRDTDARIGRIVNAVHEAGAGDDTAFLLVADHGMQLADTSVTGDWDVALHASGISSRDEGYGFIYLTDK